MLINKVKAVKGKWAVNAKHFASNSHGGGKPLGHPGANFNHSPFSRGAQVQDQIKSGCKESSISKTD